MKLIIAGSSSAGNSYVLQASTKEAIVIEAGVPFMEIKEKLRDYGLYSGIRLT